LVAMKSFRRSASLAAMSPTTSSDCPYMGDESMRRPPSSTNAPSTSSSGVRSAEVDPTSKVCQVPRPTTGIVSPVEGTGRDGGAGAGPPPRAVPARSIVILAPARPRSGSASRRLSRRSGDVRAPVVMRLGNDRDDALDLVRQRKARSGRHEQPLLLAARVDIL